MKTLSIYSPNTIQNTLSDFDKYFESFFGDSLFAPVARALNTTYNAASGALSGAPSVDIRESENAYLLDMELPGYDEKNINVHVDGTNLTISTKQEEEKKSDENSAVYLLRERKTNSFTRAFKLPENADPEAVSAVFKNGVLSMQIKKRAEAQKKMIQINAA